MYRDKILIPWEHYVDVQHGRLKAEMGDLYARWVGTRELLLHGQNPYSEEVSHKIQTTLYGHPVQQSYDKSEVIDEQRFAYPVYVVLLLAPTMQSSFAQVRTGATFVLGGLTVLGACLWMHVLNFRPHPLLAIAIGLFLLASPQIAQGLRLQQLGLLVAFFLALATWRVRSGHYFVAGTFLALSTIKPQMVVLCLVWFLVWSLGDWSKRWPLFAGFGVTLALLIGVGEVLLLGWVGYFIAGLNAYRKYFPTTSLIRLALGNWVGGILSILLAIVLFWFAWRRRTAGGDSQEFLQVLSYFFIASTFILPSLLTPFNQVLLLLPIMTLIRDWRHVPQLGRILLSVLLSWPAAMALVLLAHPPETSSLSRTALLPSALVFYFPFVLLLSLPARQRTTATNAV